MYSVQYFGIFILFYFGIPAITMNNSGSNEIEDTKDFDKEWFDVLQNQLNIVSIRFEPMVAVLMKHNPSGVKTAINWLPGKKDLPFIRQLANKSTPMHKVSNIIIIYNSCSNYQYYIILNLKCVLICLLYF